jgi:hypothetical protein
MDHTQRHERRKIIAEYARTHSIGDTAREFQVSISTVRNSCQEHDVTPLVADKHTTKFSAYTMIADLLKGMTPADVAAKHTVSRQRVCDIRDKCIKAGIEMPKRYVEYR